METEGQVLSQEIPSATGEGVRMSRTKLRDRPKILMIQPSRLLENGDPYKHKYRWLLGMPLPYLAGLTPKDYDVKILDDCYDPINFDEPCDIVAMSFMSHQAGRTYQLAQEFRNRGKTVVLGGFHVTLDHREPLQFCDSVVDGEAEYVWEPLLRDWEAGQLKPVYKADKLCDMKALPMPRYDLLDLKRYKIPNLPAQTTRGCPYGCNYCEVTQVYGGKFRYRPTSEVIDEIRELMKLGKRKFIYFVDDLFIANRRHAMEIIDALTPLKIKWTCLATANVGDDLKLLDMMKKSGCVHINIGMETINPDSLKAINKKQNRIKEYERQFKAIRDRGIEFSLNVMFGLDGDTMESFHQTVDFLKRVKAPMSFMFILAPRVGTKIRDQMMAEGRILHSDWTKYCGYETVFQPKNMTIDELNDGFWKAQQDFYSLKSIAKRLFTPPRSYTPYSVMTNLVFHWGASKKIHPLTYY